MPEQIIPCEIEEAGSVGIDTWLATLAFGASHVLLLPGTETAPSVLKALEEQLNYAQALINGLGYPRERIQLLRATDDGTLLQTLRALALQPALPVATFMTMDGKRAIIRKALDHLYQHAPQQADLGPLPNGAPFGTVGVDRAACTLCMACASVCPTSALQSGEQTPALRFRESLCVQCHLCEKACPEAAITLSARIIYSPSLYDRERVLNEEEAFRCVVCGKPFATKSMMERMSTKLKGHWMFQDEQSLRRLQMCEDCRVKDLFASQGPTND
jgi:ferredoxin